LRPTDEDHQLNKKRLAQRNDHIPSATALFFRALSAAITRLSSYAGNLTTRYVPRLLSLLSLPTFRGFCFLLDTSRKTGGALVVLRGLRGCGIVIHLRHCLRTHCVVRVFNVAAREICDVSVAHCRMGIWRDGLVVVQTQLVMCQMLGKAAREQGGRLGRNERVWWE